MRGPGLPVRALAFVVLGPGLLVPGSAAPAWAQTDCSVLGQNTFVRDTLEERYFWYRELPDLDPAAFESPEALLDAARFRPLDERFSYIADKASTDAFYSDSQFIGIGYSSHVTGPAELRVSQVYPDSPASDVGLARGDRLTEVAGTPVPDLLASGLLGAALGPSEIGYTLELAWRTLAGEEHRGTVTKRLVTIPTVSQVGVLERSGRRVGYLHFRNFVNPSFAALDQAFDFLRRMAVEDLILDLRYNGGGLVSVAQHLASLIGGFQTNSEVFAEFFHNDKSRDWNQVIHFTVPEQAIDALRVVAITTRGTASASEAVINALRPFVPVAIVGDATYGKPVGQYGFDFCEKVFFPVAFQLRNAAGQGDYFGGFEPDCPAADDLDHALADPAEASFAEALHLLESGSCSAAEAGATSARSMLRTRRSPPTDGWALLLGAH
jgi:C-terminal processing protease CtpA/Prc